MAKTVDDLLEDYLQAVEQYFHMKENLEDTMKQGYLDISKARYIMGVTSVSHYQYNADMTATATVEIDRSSTGEQTFAVARHSAATLVVEELSASRASDGGKESVRRRRGKDEAAREPASSEREEPDESSSVPSSSGGAAAPTNKLPLAADPLRWFGVLVPPPLRAAQKCFIQALAQSAEVTSQQAKCECLRSQYEAMAKTSSERPAELESKS